MKKSNPKKYFKSKKKILRIIKDMYQKVKSCVVVNIQIFSNTSDNGR